ncbi:DUF6580 family putative transport protein [Flavihumibacter petaseus]|uniref:Uncharacterized protein n=1 Tax=Flavihumibacter petaseus NBRC 106054 TaxID=1220578 RepID=A0A0E9N716_9BACT|nr:DUF6580 family putative transport protein [Flavihumibacter petaseus]GAO45140.1 hypothetical protein FPE01S_04_03830 [Flavihumibacter petaseus NBRC 106054]
MTKAAENRFLYLLCFMAAVALLRITNAAALTPWSNFTPIGAMALFGGARATGWKSFAFPITTLLASDIVINTVVYEGRYGLFYSGFYWIYIAVATIVLIGRWLLPTIAAGRLLLAAIVSGLAFWLLVDFGVWLSGEGIDISTNQPLTRNISGLLKCYAQGWPYIRNFMLSTLLYSGILFGIDAILHKYIIRQNNIADGAYAD